LSVAVRSVGCMNVVPSVASKATEPPRLGGGGLRHID
jgi:hypothetical protein